ncbi:MAG: polyprenyl synthetase family protein [Betaproteobacteria bacterium]|nr:MAG: polyprenyl synthetase family protein [Betaproteobacteria bacterium]TAG48828.1 MAG: polyprenyl synthetase family protein [Betaproteobacteria bacterium]
MSALSFDAWAALHRTRTEAVLERFLPKDELASGRMFESMRYSVLGGGKRLRALLAYASAEAVGASADVADHAAASVEMIHAYSLIHDDMPCMDNDDMRRGKPTNHVAFGDATAMLAGDALQPLAFRVLLDTDASAAGIVAASRMLADASGARGMAGGQAIDLANVGKPMTQAALEEMHALKTGAMFEAAVVLPALLVESDDERVDALTKFAANIGLAFQVVDDVLDATADSATLGKTAGKDAAADKPTFVSLMGIEAADAYARVLTRQAIAAVETLGGNNARLIDVAFAMAERKS